MGFPRFLDYTENKDIGTSTGVTVTIGHGRSLLHNEFQYKVVQKYCKED